MRYLPLELLQQANAEATHEAARAQAARMLGLPQTIRATLIFKRTHGVPYGYSSLRLQRHRLWALLPSARQTLQPSEEGSRS